MRPIRPDDTERLRAFVDGLSERSRYQRFMQALQRLTPAMLERFTHIDYPRELALVALEYDTFVAVGRYAPNEDGKTAEFALVTADAWQGRGIGRALLERLCNEARAAGYRALYGHILADNRDMLTLAERLGFRLAGRDGAAITVVREL